MNVITKADCQPMPRMEDCIDRIGKVQHITKCDLLKGCWAVPLTEGGGGEEDICVCDTRRNIPISNNAFWHEKLVSDICETPE